MVDQPRYRSRFNDPGDDDWADGRSERRAYRRPEPRLDQWMSAGRQLVDGVAGARPGSRPSARGTGSAAGPRLRPGDLGRWVENKIDWLLEDDDGWREPWQEPRRSGRESVPDPVAPRSAPSPDPSSAPVSRRRPLEAVSLRGTPLLPERPAAGVDQDWPDEASFSVSRWRRGDAPARTPRDSELGSASASPSPRSPDPQGQPAAPPPRAMPRSSRRRPG